MIEINKEFYIDKKKDNYTIVALSADNDLIQEFATTNELAQAS